MLALVCLGIPIFSMLLIGFPLRGLLGRFNTLEESAWIDVPFLGLALPVFVLQLLVYANVPVCVGVWLLAGMVAILWTAWLFWGPVRASLRHFPKVAFAVAALVLLIQSAGLFLRGAEVYRGRAWSDQFNYTAMAEYFRFYGFGVTENDLGQHPWMITVVVQQHARIGQSVLQAYHAVLTNQDTADLFMPTIFLCGPLLALALYAAARAVHLTTAPAVLAAVLGGLTPGITALLLECFQSHALGIPLLLYLPTVMARYSIKRSADDLCVATLYCGCLISVYTEFHPFTAILTAYFFFYALTQQPRNLLHLSGFALLLAAPFLFNPFILAPLRDRYAILQTPDMLAHIYPWSYSLESLVAVWVGDFALFPPSQYWRAQDLWKCTALASAGIVGLIGVCWQAFRQRAANPGGWGLPMALLGLASVPLIVWLKDREHGYQLYKLLVTMSPLCALGLAALGGWALWPWDARLANRPLQRRLQAGIAWGVLLLFAETAVEGSLAMAIVSSKLSPSIRTSQASAASKDFNKLRQYLSSMSGQSMLYRPAAHDWFQQIWIMYYARNNDLWLGDPRILDGIDFEALAPPAHNIVDLRTLPTSCVILAQKSSMYLQPPATMPSDNLLWESPSYFVWRAPAYPWACIVNVANAQSTDDVKGHRFTLGDPPALVRIYSSSPGWVSLVLELAANDDSTANEHVRLWITNSNGSEEIHQFIQGRLEFKLPVQHGANDLKMQVDHGNGAAPGHGAPVVLAEVQLQNMVPEEFAERVP